jgi:hypothetical protein
VEVYGIVGAMIINLLNSIDVVECAILELSPASRKQKMVP